MTQDSEATRLDPPAPGAGPLTRGRYGFGLPLAILRAVWASAAERRMYLRVTLLQLAVSIAVTAAVTAAVVSPLHRDGRDDRQIRFSISGMNVHWDRGAEVEPADPPPRQGTIERARSWLGERVGSAAAFWSEVYATFAVVEWLVIALSREYHDALSKRASLLTGVPPEDTPERPSVRVNVRWLMKKLRRRIRGALLVAVGAPVLWPVFLLPKIGSPLQAALLGAWGAYWLVLFTVGKTEHAWAAQAPPDPWFLRWSERASKHRWLRWWLWPWYARLLRRMGGPLSSPAAHLERAPYESAGLSLARAVTRLPGIYTFFRPIVPVAATHVVLGPGRIVEMVEGDFDPGAAARTEEATLSTKPKLVG